MEEIGGLNSPRLVEAIQLWTGWGQSMMPSRDDKRVVERFGKDDAARLLPLIRSLEGEFYLSDAQFVAANIQEMGDLASDRFKRLHPEVAEEIVKVFSWCYTFDFK